MASSFVLLVTMVSLVGGGPVTSRWIDLSYPYDNKTIHWTTVKPFLMDITDYGPENYGVWVQLENIETATHVGTHMDAPCHFVQGRWCIDEIPISHFIAPAAVVDISEESSKDRDTQLTVRHLEEWEKAFGEIPRGSILILRTGWGKFVQEPSKYFGFSANNTGDLHFPGVSAGAAHWLMDNRVIYGIGTEAASIDAGQSKKFEVHQIVEEKNVFSLENLDNVEELPAIGATIYAFPMKIANSSGAPCRVLANIPASKR